jgi:hypothetical protein
LDVFLTNDQLIHLKEIELQDKNKKVELVLKLLEKNISIDDIKELVGPINFNDETYTKYNIIDRELKQDETNIDDHTNVNLNLKERAPLGQKIQKIDPDNLKNIIKIYPSMVYALRAPENNGFNKSSIQSAIKKNGIYKGFRWNFVKKDQDPTISIAEPTKEFSKPSIRYTIIQLNKDKTEIIETFYTKDFTAKHLNIGKTRMKNIIKDCTLYNNSYFVEIHNCPKELLDSYDKPINRIIPTNSKQIKQIHPITKQVVIFNSLLEIYNKLGISSKTILGAIENKTIYNGSIWEFNK